MDFQNAFVTKILDINSIEADFGQLHHLIDKLFQNEDDMEQQNSYLFHIKFSLILSCMVQMKNSLVKYLDYEINEENPEMNLNLGMTQQPVVINDLEEELTQSLSIYTPHSVCADQGTQGSSPLHQRDSLNLLIFHDDSTFLMNYTTRSLECKGVKIVHLPSIYDAKSVVPFLLLNDHSILLV